MRRPWSNKEIKFLEENYKTMSYVEMSKILKRNQPSIKGKIVRLGLKSDRWWAHEELQYLKNNYKTKTYKEISEVLNKKEHSIKTKISRLNLPDKVRGKNVKGMTFGDLKVLKTVDLRNEKGQKLWECLCACGNKKLTTSTQLISGKTTSCGCKKANMIGENHPAYNPLLSEKDRRSKRYILGDRESKQIRSKTFERDNYTCSICYQRGGDLNAHHIESWDSAPDKRFDIDNLVTLCINCHSEFHKQYGYGNNTKNQFEEYISSRNRREVRR